MQQLVEGRTGTLPDGTRVIVRGGRVVPLEGQGAGVSGAGQRGMDGSLYSPPGPRGGAPQRIGGLATQEQIQLANARRAAAGAQASLGDLERFDRLQDEQGSGGLMALPFAREIVGAFDPEVAEMNEIQARLTPAQREPGSGPMSDRDVLMYERSAPGVQRPEEANRAIVDRGRSSAGRDILRAEFLDRYARQYGTLNGAEAAWRQFYDPPPVQGGSPPPRANLETTAAQRATLERLNREGRNRNAVLGSRQNPRFPPEGYDIGRLPRGDWYVAPDGQLRQAGVAASRGRGSGGRDNDPLGIRG